MLKPNDLPTSREKRLSRRLTAMTAAALISVTVMLLQQPLLAAAGIASATGDRGAPHGPPRPLAAASPPVMYQLRCWQHGRLLFDEGPVALGAELRHGERLVATDPSGAAVIVTVTGETTCQARPYLVAPNLVPGAIEKD